MWGFRSAGQAFSENSDNDRNQSHDRQRAKRGALICRALAKPSSPALTLLAEGHLAVVCLRVRACLQVPS